MFPLPMRFTIGLRLTPPEGQTITDDAARWLRRAMKSLTEYLADDIKPHQRLAPISYSWTYYEPSVDAPVGGSRAIVTIEADSHVEDDFRYPGDPTRKLEGLLCQLLFEPGDHQLPAGWVAEVQVSPRPLVPEGFTPDQLAGRTAPELIHLLAANVIAEERNAALIVAFALARMLGAQRTAATIARVAVASDPEGMAPPHVADRLCGFAPPAAA